MKNKLIVFGLIIVLIVAYAVIIGQAYDSEENVLAKSLSKSASALECKDKEKKKEVIVYITKTGKKYHKGSCRYLKKSKIKITLEKACKGGYTPCKVCKPPKCPK